MRSNSLAAIQRVRHFAAVLRSVSSSRAISLGVCPSPKDSRLAERWIRCKGLWLPVSQGLENLFLLFGTGYCMFLSFSHAVYSPVLSDIISNILVPSCTRYPGKRLGEELQAAYSSVSGTRIVTLVP